MNELEWNVTAGERPPAYNPTNKRKEEIQLNSIDCWPTMPQSMNQLISLINKERKKKNKPTNQTIPSIAPPSKGSNWLELFVGLAAQRGCLVRRSINQTNLPIQFPFQRTSFFSIPIELTAGLLISLPFFGGSLTHSIISSLFSLLGGAPAAGSGHNPPIQEKEEMISWFALPPAFNKEFHFISFFN